MNGLRVLHERQMEAIDAAKKLGRKKKKRVKKGLREARALVTGGAAVMIADATFLPLAAPMSYVAGFLAIAGGVGKT